MGIPDVEPEASEEEVDVEVMGAFGRLPVDECVAMALLCELSLGMEPGEPITSEVIAAAARGRVRLEDELGAERVRRAFGEVGEDGEAARSG